MSSCRYCNQRPGKPKVCSQANQSRLKVNRIAGEHSEPQDKAQEAKMLKVLDEVTLKEAMATVAANPDDYSIGVELKWTRGKTWENNLLLKHASDKSLNQRIALQEYS